MQVGRSSIPSGAALSHNGSGPILPVAEGSGDAGGPLLREALAGSRDGLVAAFMALDDVDASVKCILRRADETLVSARFDIEPRYGRGHWEFLRLGRDVFAIILNAQYAARTTMYARGEDLIEFHFRLSGDFHLATPGESFDLSSGVMMIIRQPVGCDAIEHFGGAGARESCVSLYCYPSFIERIFGDLENLTGCALNPMLGQHCDHLRAFRSALYPGLARLVLDLAIAQHRQGALLVRAEALATQIICEVLTNFCEQKPSQSLSSTTLSDRDVACLRAAREIVAAEYAPAPSIEKLSRRVGLSATKLKQGFRLLYGETIMDFATDLRMKAAKALLRKKDEPIGNVAETLGFTHQNSFTVAFRRHFGVLPREYRRDPFSFDRRDEAGA